MGKNKVLVKVHPEGKYVVDIEKDIDIASLTPGQQTVAAVGLVQQQLVQQSSRRQEHSHVSRPPATNVVCLREAAAL